MPSCPSTLACCPTLAARGSETVFWESGSRKAELRECGGLNYSLQTALKGRWPGDGVLPWPNRGKVAHTSQDSERGKEGGCPISCGFTRARGGFTKHELR